jgi:ATP-dependent RNA helicase DDX1
VRFLICTDVAARGLDIKGLPYVVNLTLPDEIENYIHRIGAWVVRVVTGCAHARDDAVVATLFGGVGRVGRSDCMGLAVSFVSSYKEKVCYTTVPV